MLKLATKLFLSSGTLTGVALVDFSSSNITFTKQNKTKIENLKTSIEQITTLDEIRLFEKVNECSFAFVNRWSEKEVYKLDGFLNKNKDQNWDSNVIKGANRSDSKDNCKKKKPIPLFNANNHNGFVPDKPSGGW